MHQVFAVDKRQCVERGQQHLPDFVRRERPVRKNLSECLLGMIHDDEEERVTRNLTRARVENANQVRM